MINLLAAGNGGYQAFHLGGNDKVWLYICLVAEGMVGAWGRRPAMLNPSFELVAGADDSAGD